MLTSPTYIKILLKKHGFKTKKSLGQNFLIDENTVNRIVDGADISQEDIVIEIGPGIGTMTQALAKQAQKVFAFEIDRCLFPLLEETLAEFNNIEVINKDALKVNFDDFITNSGTGKLKVVANLPYYITTPIVMHLLESKFKISTLVVMVQKEVAERMVANPGGKEYGALSVAVQFYSNVHILFKVPPTVFMPKPEVESAVVRMDILNEPKVDLKDEKTFFRVVRASFGQRRKTLLNALNNAGLGLAKEELLKILAECAIDPQRRGETLSIEDFALLSNNINIALNAKS